MLKKIILQVILGLIVGLFMAGLYTYLPAQFSSLDNKIRDFYFFARGKIPTTDSVVIVDIDEQSLASLGQWPWSRNKMAQVLENLSAAGVGIIGLDIVFAERDNSSPKKVLEELGLSFPNAPDYDEIYAKAVANTPTILGYVFAMNKDDLPKQEAPQIPAVFIEKGKSTSEELLLSPYRPTLNIPIIQNAAYSSGFFNTIPDSDSGIIRSVPLAMKYDLFVYPSLAFEMIRAASGVDRIYVEYDPGIGVLGYKIGETIIPTDRYGRLFVNFRGPSFSFPYISAADVYNNDFNKSQVEGKYVLIGTSASGLLDLRAMPFDNVYPGVEIHANVIDNILKQDFIQDASWMFAPNLLMIVFLPILMSSIFAFSSAFTALIVFGTFLGGFIGFTYYMLFSQGLIINNLFVFAGLMLSFIVSIALNYFLETRQKNIIKGKFASKVSYSVMEDILKAGTATLEGKEKEISVFFSDIRRFTDISETIGEPKKLINFLNAYMTPMSDIITKSGGTIDKYIGDMIMAYWNAPADIKDHADKAVSAGLESLHKLRLLNQSLSHNPDYARLKKLGSKPVEIGIGINTGLAIVGEMGSQNRSDYTVIGDSINLGSRLESLCKFYDSRLNISEYTKNKLSQKYIIRSLDLVTVKGKTQPIEIFNVLDFEQGLNGEFLFSQNKDEILEEIFIYEKALFMYRDSNFKESLEIFKRLDLNEKKSNKNIYKEYINRCDFFIQNPPKNFNGVFVHTQKG